MKLSCEAEWARLSCEAQWARLSCEAEWVKHVSEAVEDVRQHERDMHTQ